MAIQEGLDSINQIVFNFGLYGMFSSSGDLPHKFFDRDFLHALLPDDICLTHRIPLQCLFKSSFHPLSMSFFLRNSYSLT